MNAKTIFLAAVGISALSCASQTWAQSAPQAAPDPQSPGIPDPQVAPDPQNPGIPDPQAPNNEASTGSDIVVTASRSKETLRRAPIAVTVVTQDELTKGGANSIQTLSSTAPNVQIQTVGSFNATLVSIRGVNNSNPTSAGNPAVATYIDGIYVGYTGGLTGAFYDLDRLEVLRGPQGTLYGRNSTGGNLNIFTADPVNSFRAAGDISYGNYNDVQARATINLPVSDTLSLRFAGIVHRNDGYVDTRGATARNYARADDFGGRITALWKPTDSFSWRLSADKFFIRGTPGKQHEVRADGSFSDPGAPFHPTISPYPEPINKVDNLFIRSRMEYNFGSGLLLAYLAGYQNVKFGVQYAWNNAAGAITSAGFQERKYHSQSHEVTLSYENGAFKNIVGASYFESTNTGGAAFLVAPAGILFGSIDEGGNFPNAKGIFDQATIEVLPGLKLLGGVRYSSEKVDTVSPSFVYCTSYMRFIGTSLANQYRNLRTLGSTDPLCRIAPNPDIKATFNNTTWKGGLTFDLSNDVSGYATVTTGFKSGGANSTGVPFLPEKIINYETGLKFRTLNGKLNVNTAVFWEDYTNLQVISQSGVINLTTNAAAARIRGIETEARFQPTPNDRITGFIAYLDARFTDYPNAPDPLDNRLFPNLKGSHLPTAPKYSARLTYAHDFALSNGAVLTASAIGYWQDDMFLRVFNRQIDRVKGYTKSDADLTYVAPEGHWSLSAFVHNIEDRIRRNSAYNSSGLYQSEVNPPRTYGLRLSAQY